MLRIRDVYHGSQMFITDPRSWFLPIPDPGSRISDPGSRISDSGSRIPDLGSRISDPGSRIPDLGSRISDPGSRIPDPGSRNPGPGSRIKKQQPKRGVKKISCHTFFCSHKFHKIENYFIFEMLKKKILGNFQRIIELFTQKFVTKLWKKYGFGIRGPRSGIRK